MIRKPSLDLEPSHYPILSTKNLEAHPLTKELKLDTPRAPAMQDIDLNITDSPTSSNDSSLHMSNLYSSKDQVNMLSPGMMFGTIESYTPILESPIAKVLSPLSTRE